MTGAAIQEIDSLMERASKALAATHYFEAERLAYRALTKARRASEFEAMARICLPLQEARRQRLMLALDAAEEAGITMLSEPFDDEFPIEPGCYIIDPMNVASDARRIRQRGFDAETPVAVLAREPITQTGLQPIAAIGQVVVRTRVRPAKTDPPTLAWFVESLETLGDAAIEEIDPVLAGERLIDALLDRLDTLPLHEKLHQALADAARATADELAAAG